MPTESILEPTFTLQQLAKWSGQTEGFWRLEISRRRLKARQFGVNVRVLRSDLEAYINASVKRGPHPARQSKRARRRSTAAMGPSRLPGRQTSPESTSTDWTELASQ